MNIRSGAANTRLVETKLDGEVVVGTVEFEVNGGSPRNNFLDYFYFVDAEGLTVAATAGTVTLELSPVAGIWHEVADGTFNAITALDSDFVKPNGFGKALAARFTFVGITGDPTGFRSLLTQSVA